MERIDRQDPKSCPLAQPSIRGMDQELMIPEKEQTIAEEEEKRVTDPKVTMTDSAKDSIEDEWLKFRYESQDSFGGSFSINKYLLDEEFEASKLIMNLKKPLFQTRPKTFLSKYDSNPLWVDSKNYKAQIYSSFVPNKVNF